MVHISVRNMGQLGRYVRPNGEAQIPDQETFSAFISNHLAFLVRQLVANELAEAQTEGHLTFELVVFKGIVDILHLMPRDEQGCHVILKQAGFEEEMLSERGVGNGVIGVGHVITTVNKA